MCSCAGVLQTQLLTKIDYKTSYFSVDLIQVPQKVLTILLEHKERQRSASARFSGNWRICGGAKAISDSLLEKRNRDFAEKAGLHHIRIHDFRHSHASLLCSAGINIQEVARRLGHKDVKMTWSTYAHLYPEDMEQAVFVLDKIVP